MKHLIIISGRPFSTLASQLLEMDIVVSYLRNEALLHQYIHSNSMANSLEYLVLVDSLNLTVRLDDVIEKTQSLCLPWLAITDVQQAKQTQDMYRLGARAVIPEGTDAEVIATIVQRCLQEISANNEHKPFGSRRRHYFTRERIELAADQVLILHQGTAAIMAMDQHGEQRTLGFASAGEVLFGLDDERYSLSVLAHTDIEVSESRWGEIQNQPGFSEALERRLKNMQYWLLVLAETSVEKRVVQSLRSLSRQSGIVDNEAATLGFRLTHAELATAICATRSTVTKSISRLRQEGRVRVTRDTGGDRFQLLLASNAGATNRTIS